MKIFSTLNSDSYNKELIRCLEILGEKAEISSLEEANVLLLVRKGRKSGTDNPLQFYTGKPAVLVMGTLDPEGEVLLRETTKKGFPEENILVCPNGTTSISFESVADALKRVCSKPSALWECPEDFSSKKECLTQGEKNPSSDDFSLKEESSLREGCSNKESSLTGKLKETEILTEKQAENSFLDMYRNAYDHLVAVVGAKGGVGVSTVCVSLNAAFDEFGSFHLETRDRDCLYYDKETFSKNYGCVQDSSRDVKGGKILFIDTKPDLLDRIISQVDLVIMVADTSPMSFENVKKWCQQHLVNILVLNKLIYGIGITPEVYSGELGIEKIISLPGGTDEERVLIKAQQDRRLPTGVSVEYDTAIGEICACIREVFKF